MSPAQRDEEPKVFDVRKTKFPPPATSKPIIVGHHPMMPDPMLHPRLRFPSTAKHEIPAAAGPIDVNKAKIGPPASSEPKTVTQPGQTIAPQAAVPKSTETAPSPPATNNIALPEDLKVKLPAGAAAHNRQRAGWIVLLVGIPIILLIAVYLYSK